jgi:hypothetical protein
MIFWVCSSEGCVIAPAGHMSSQPRQKTTHAFLFPFCSSIPNALAWQKSTHFPHEVHFVWSIFGAHGILFLGIPGYSCSVIRIVPVSPNIYQYI